MRKHLTTGRIAGYLMCLTAVCSVVIGVTYARYASSVGGTATAAVAAVELGGRTEQPIDLSGMRPGDHRAVSFQVVNFSGDTISETAQDYTITIKTAGNLPLDFTLTADDAAAPARKLEGAAGRWSTALAGSLPAGISTTHSYTLSIAWPAAQAEAAYADEIDAVTLIVDAVQTLPAAP